MRVKSLVVPLVLAVAVVTLPACGGDPPAAAPAAWSAEPATPGGATPPGGTAPPSDSPAPSASARPSRTASFFVSNDRTGTLKIENSTLRGNPSQGFQTKGLPGIFFLGASATTR
ncbi:hypothetical protein AB0H57_03815 [Micromonospora sp. NPDC050686]|uniref:hypothetical protein n=1 Tax=Micromonospora sp. NPDC050686 TaxID=3154631 RepID=UPI0034047F93